MTPLGGAHERKAGGPGGPQPGRCTLAPVVPRQRPPSHFAAALGPEHPATLTSVCHLGQLLVDVGSDAEAVELFFGSGGTEASTWRSTVDMSASSRGPGEER